MNRSYSKLRHIQEANKRLENKLILEKIGEPLTPEAAGSKKAQFTKEIANYLNQYYKINLPAATTGSWTDQDYNDTFEKFLTEMGLKVHKCKSNDGWCRPGADGEVGPAKEDYDKFLAIIRNKGVSNTQAKINTTFDKAYDYKLENGKYYFKGKENTKYSKKHPNWIEATGKGLDAIKANVKF